MNRRSCEINKMDPRTLQEWQSVRTFCDFSRHDRARNVICRLRTVTDRFKENYNIDDPADDWRWPRPGTKAPTFPKLPFPSTLMKLKSDSVTLRLWLRSKLRPCMHSRSRSETSRCRIPSPISPRSSSTTEIPIIPTWSSFSSEIPTIMTTWSSFLLRPLYMIVDATSWLAFPLNLSGTQIYFSVSWMNKWAVQANDISFRRKERTREKHKEEGWRKVRRHMFFQSLKMYELKLFPISWSR